MERTENATCQTRLIKFESARGPSYHYIYLGPFLHLLPFFMFCISIRSLLRRNFFSLRSLSSSPLILHNQILCHHSLCSSVTRFASTINSGSSRLGSFKIRLDHTMATPSKTSVHDFTVKVQFLVPFACYFDTLFGL